MAWTYAANLPYGITGRTLTAVFVDSTLTPLVSQPAYTITEHPGASGFYYLRSAAMPDGFDGSIQYFDAGVQVSAEAVLPRYAENLDAKVSSVSALIAALPSAAAIATAVWANAAATALIASVTTLLTSVTTLLSRLTAQRATNLDNLDAPVSSISIASLVVPASQIAAVLVGQDLTLHRGDSLVIVIGNLPALTGATKVWFSLKKHHADTDAAALVQIDLTGLLRLNGAAGTLAQGSLTVDTAAAPGQVTVRLAAAASAQLVPAGGLYWDLQMLAGGQVTTLTEGRARVAADVTGAVA